MAQINNTREKEMNPFLATVLGGGAGIAAQQLAGAALSRTKSIREILNSVNQTYPAENTKIFKDYLSRKGVKGSVIFTKAPTLKSVIARLMKTKNPNISQADLDAAVDAAMAQFENDPRLKAALNRINRLYKMPHSNPRFNYMWAGNVKNPAIGLHEAGHLVNYKFLKNPKAVFAAQALSRGVLPAAGMLAGIILANQNEDSKANLAPIIAGAGFAPMLLDEGAASARAFKEMARIGGGYRKTWGQSKSLLPAFGTYAALAGAGVGSVYLIKKLLESRRRNNVRKINSYRQA
jgi:hypothetical protein